MISDYKYFLVVFCLFGSYSYGNNCRVTQIVLQGNNHTRDWVIKREIPIQLDTLYSIDNLIQLKEVSKNQIVNLHLFNTVDVDLIFSADSTNAELHVSLTEKWYVWPIPTLEFVDRNFYQWGSFQFDPGRLNYGLYLFCYNLAGLNHTVKFSLINGYSRVYGIEYRIPYFDRKKRWGTTVQWSHRRSKEINLETLWSKQSFVEFKSDAYRNHNLSFILQYKPGYFHHFQGFAGFYQQNTHPEVFLLNKNYQPFEGNIKKFGIGLGWKYSNTDNNYFPWRGKQASLQLTQHFLNEKYRYSEILGSSGLYGKLNKRFFYALGMTGRLRSKTDLPYPFRSALGYQYYVRGYEPYVIDGSNFLLLKSELRISLLDDYRVKFPVKALKMYREMVTRSHLSLFADAGNVFNLYSLNQIYYPYIWQLGAGIGLNFVLYYDKVIRFEYSRNLDAERIWNLRFSKSL